MKHLLYILLFCCSWGYGQREDYIHKSVPEETILLQELMYYKERVSNHAYTRTKVGDSLILNKTVLRRVNDKRGYRQLALDSQELSEIEAKEIFGDIEDNLFATNVDNFVEWTQDDFKNHKIFFYDNKKHDASIFKSRNSLKTNLQTTKVLHLAFPIIRKDGKYALLQVENWYEGGALHIYKKTEQMKWILYKIIPLYLT